MLRVREVHVLRHKVLIEGKSQRAVAREMGISRNTVRRYLAESEPVARKRVRGRPALERVRPRLDALLEEWSERTTPKQRLTATRLHRQLCEEGYEVGVTLVRGYLREWRRQRAEVFVPLVHRPGDEAQVDFFEVTVELGGERRKAWKFLMRLMYSGRDFVRLYDRQDQLAFLDGHVRAFAHFGGVPGRIVYDNLKPAVRRLRFPAASSPNASPRWPATTCSSPASPDPGRATTRAAWRRAARRSGCSTSRRCRAATRSPRSRSGCSARSTAIPRLRCRSVSPRSGRCCAPYRGRRSTRAGCAPSR